MDNYYEILDIKIEASAEEIKRAVYKKNKYFERLLEQNEKTDLTEIKSKHFFLKTIEKTLLDNQKRNVYNKKIQRNLKRKLDQPKPKNENSYTQIIEQEIHFGTFKNYGVFKKIKGIIVEGVSVTEKKIGATTVFYQSLKNVTTPIAKATIIALIIIYLKFWVLLLFLVWQFKDLLSMPMSKIMDRKIKGIKQFAHSYFKDLRKIYKPKSAIVKTLNFKIRIDNTRLIEIGIKKNPIRGVLNAGDKVSIIVYGFSDHLMFFSGKNLRSNSIIKTS